MLLEYDQEVEHMTSTCNTSYIYEMRTFLTAYPINPSEIYEIFLLCPILWNVEPGRFVVGAGAENVSLEMLRDCGEFGCEAV